MSIQQAPRGLRLQIGIFGRRNAGKSSLLNALAGQNVVIVSDVPGTTADPVEKAMEMPPIGPVLLIDTAGLDDDQAEIGAKRAARSRMIMDRCDIALIVACGDGWGELEDELVRTFRARNVPFAVVFSQTDRIPVPRQIFDSLAAGKVPTACVSAKTGEGLGRVRQILIDLAPEDFLSSVGMLGDLVRPMEPVLLITPVDKEAPKGRMILPEVQAIRDVLDHSAYCVVTTDRAAAQALADLNRPPCLAVTDSQVFGAVSKLVPENIPLTSFSILLARMKGDLATCVSGAAAIGRLHDGSKVLIAEACTHHPVGEDIGRVKLPRWIREYTKKDVAFDVKSGADFPDDPSAYDLVVHCGACTFNRRGVLSRMLKCREKGVPFTNYGVAIAYVHGILKRA